MSSTGQWWQLLQAKICAVILLQGSLIALAWSSVTLGFLKPYFQKFKNHCQRQQTNDIFSGVAWYYGDNDFII